jgi:hypothetical protein
MALGDYLQYQRENIAVSADGVITATAQAATTAIAVRSANHQIFIQKIALSITTHANAKVALHVQPHSTTAQVTAHRTDLTAAAGVPDFILWDFGPKGIAIPVGESVDWLWSTGDSGPVGVVHMEGYQKLGATVALGTSN